MINTSASSRFRRRRNDPRRRPHHQGGSNRGPEEKLYEIRDIKAEKWQGNTLLYLIDWADNRVTGEAYENTWEPAQNVTQAAIEDWEREKQRRQAAERRRQRSSVESSSESDSQPVRPSNWRKRRHHGIVSGSDRARLYKRARTSRSHDGASFPGDFAEEDWPAAGPLPDRRGEIVLELRVDPGFDPREYIAISLSQSSQASQNSRPSDSSAPRTAESESVPRTKNKVSQTTIPDSQEISDSLPSLPSQFTVDPLLVEASQLIETDVVAGLGPPTVDDDGGDNDDDNIRAIQADPVSSEESGLNIPSRQPDNFLSGHKTSQQSVGTFEAQDETSPGPQNPSLQASFSPRTSSRFLTQPEFNLPAFLQASSAPEACGVDPASGNTPNNPLSHSPTTDDVPSHSQAAQVVAPLSSYPKQIQTQTQHILESTRSEVVPETALKSAPRIPAAQSATPDFQEHDNPGNIADDPFLWRQRSLSAMSFEDDDNTSFAEKLRRMRDSIISEPLFPSSRHASVAPAPAAAQPQPLEQSVISPSSVLPAMDKDNEAQRGALPGQMDSSIAWHDAPTGISLRSIDMAVASEPDQRLSVGPVEAASFKVAQDIIMSIHDNFGQNTELPPSHFSTAHEQQSAFQQIPATIAPSELTNAAVGLLPDNHALDVSSGYALGPLLPEPESDPYPQDAGAEADLEHHNEERPQGEYIVTLPMAANTRSEYLKRISGENEKTMLSFGEGFSESLTWVPSDALLAKMDHIFQQLLDLCDLPAYVHDVAELSPDAMWKHATGTNSKFSFVFEFLTAIRDLNTRVLVLCRPGYTFQYLEALLSAPGFNYSILGQESARPHLDGLTITLASAEQDLTVLQGQVDIIISFDHVSRAVDLSQVVSGTVPPLVLFLVITHSIEHIDLQMGPEPEGIERKNALNLAIGTARGLLKSPDRNLEPHEAAEVFAAFVRNPEDELLYETSAVPEHVFDLWLSSQANTQDAHMSGHATNNRKRRLDEDEVRTPKRARILEATSSATPVQMSDLLKSTLSKYSSPTASPAQMVELPVSQLESMAAKIAELESNLAAQTSFEEKQQNLVKNLEDQVRSLEKSVRRIQPKYIEATRDRGIFEKENKAIKKQLEERDLQMAKLREQNEALQAKLDTPELARSEAAEKEVTEARAKIQSLEKRLAGAERDMEYLRGQYQTATSEAGKFENEKRELLSRIADLEMKARDNFLKAHLKNSEINAEEQLRQLREKEEMILNLERDVERAREELRVLKSGRRETRQASVPRSPMPGSGGIMMSPRPPRNTNVAAAAGGQQRGSGSRGTSPAPAVGNFSNIGEAYSSAAAVLSGPGSSSGPTGPVSSSGSSTFFTQPTGNGGRWDHLRD